MNNFWQGEEITWFENNDCVVKIWAFRGRSSSVRSRLRSILLSKNKSRTSPPLWLFDTKVASRLLITSKPVTVVIVHWHHHHYHHSPPSSPSSLSPSSSSSSSCDEKAQIWRCQLRFPECQLVNSTVIPWDTTCTALNRHSLTSYSSLSIRSSDTLYTTKPDTSCHPTLSDYKLDLGMITL